MKITIASYITLLRIVLAPFVVIAILQQRWGSVLLLFLLAMITDWLDGFVARRYGQESKLGQLLDPIADKILIVSALYPMLYNIADWVVQYAIIFLMIKEGILVAGAAVLHYKYQHFIKPSRLSRAASVAEMVLVLFLSSLLYIRNRLPSLIVWITDLLRMHKVVPDVIFRYLVILCCAVSVALLIRYSIFIWKLHNSQLNKRV